MESQYGHAGLNLVHMDAGIFCPGMRVDAKIFYRQKDAYVLLCKNIVLNKELTEKLRQISIDYGGVYVEAEHYEEIWNESIRRYAVEADGYLKTYKKVRNDYEDVLSKTTRFLDQISAGGGIPTQVAGELTDVISSGIVKHDEGLVLRCINMIGEVDDYLYNHCVNVASLNGLLGRWLGLSDKDIKQLIKIGLLHDLGKLQVGPEILNKPAKLTEEEFTEMKRHSVYSYQMLIESGETDLNILSGVRNHHEKPNGSGYPDQLKQEDIPLFARITAVSDVYDAMVSKRCYKDAKSPFDILDQFLNNRFLELDFNIVDVFVSNITCLFVGMTVRLSNGEEGEVMFVSSVDPANPVVKVGTQVFSTNDNVKCVSVESFF